MEPSTSTGGRLTWTRAALVATSVFLFVDKWPQISTRLMLWQTVQLLPDIASTSTTAPAANSTDAIADIVERYAAGCPDHHHTTRLISADPLMLYIENLLSKHESSHLLALAEPHYKPSAIVGPAGKEYDSNFRTSVSAKLPNDDAVVSCIRKRVADFQSFMPVDRVEDIHAVKHGINEYIRPHHDWHEAMLNPRISTLSCM